MIILMKYFISYLWMVCTTVSAAGACSSDSRVAAGGKEGDAPVITSVTPLTGDCSTLITVSGANFSRLASYNRIVLNETRAFAPEKATETELVFRMPEELFDGDYIVQVQTAEGIATADAPFRLRTPVDDRLKTLPTTPKSVNALLMQAGQPEHPYLFFTDAELSKQRELARNDAELQAVQDLIVDTADRILSQPLISYALDGANLRIPGIHDFANDQVPYLVLAYRLSGDKRYADRCWRQMEALLEWPDWGAYRHFLDTGIGAKGCAMIYDGLYDYLSESQRTALYQGTRRLALEPGLSQMKGGKAVWRWYASKDNWNGICHGGLIDAALAMYDRDPAFCADVITQAVNRLPLYIRSFDPDGASVEGMMYWSYGLSNTMLSLEAMQRNLGTTFGLSDSPGFRQTGWFPYKMAGPVGSASFGDDFLYYSPEKKYLSYFWFARHFRDPDLAKTHYLACLQKNAANPVKFNSWLDYLYYDPQLVASGSSSNIPESGYLRGVEYLFLREDSSDDAFYIGIHAGDNNASHGHLDAGTFFIQANGQNFAAGSLGTTSPYPADYFDTAKPGYTDAGGDRVQTTGRFSYYRTRAEGKSVVVINPDARPEQDPKGVAAVVRQGRDSHLLDLSQCYSRDVTAYRRGVAIDRARRAVIVQDEFTLRNPGSTVYWLMHTSAIPGYSVAPDKRSVTLTQEGRQVVFRILSPSSATFEVVPPSDTDILFLDETRPIFSDRIGTLNQVNKGFGKLQIRLSDLSGPQTICVECADVAAPVGTVVPLDNWK